ncbi:uracil/xanthine transporter [Neobacillus sp. SM06]|uniref:uracil/xanthine transporter n=1 Tax=Neobacillus sp. SM06 TaxID=3422492 RepID=UPI003D2E059F
MPLSNTFLAGFQWLFFMFANTVVIPLTIGDAFQLPAAEIAGALQRSFIFTGAACILQALFGHKSPIMEGQSGLWWGTILSLSAAASSAGMSVSELGGGISVGILLSGMIVAVLGALGIGKILNRLFSPVVMSTVLFLLATQLIVIFTKGMLGLTTTGKINLPIAGLSLFLVILVAAINIKGKGLIGNFAILIGIIVGWIAYVLFFPKVETKAVAPQLIHLFPWGQPNFNIGIVLMIVLTGLVNTTNTIGALKGAEPVLRRKTTETEYRRSFFLTGLNSIVSGFFGLVPYAPYISSVGFLQSTQIIEVAPFILGAILFMILGLVPFLGHLFSSLPVSVGDAVLFVAYLQLFGGALSNLKGIVFTSKTIYRIALPVLLGIAVMNIPASMFSSIPLLIRPLVSNGLIVGILISIVLENLIDWSKLEIGLIKKES